MKACIFDLDGTLANTLTTLAHFGNSALATCGYPEIPVDDYRFLVGNGVNRLIFGMLKTVTKAEPENSEVSRVRSIYDALYASNPLHLTKPYDGISKLLSQLRQRNYKLAVLSNKPHEMTLRVIHELFGKNTFDVCYGQRDEVARKPAPDGALIIARELNIHPSDFLYIGDSGVDMKTGSAAGMQTVGVLWGFRPREELAQNGAIHLVSHPQDILSICENN